MRASRARRILRKSCGFVPHGWPDFEWGRGFSKRRGSEGVQVVWFRPIGESAGLEFEEGTEESARLTAWVIAMGGVGINSCNPSKGGGRVGA